MFGCARVTQGARGVAKGIMSNYVQVVGVRNAHHDALRIKRMGSEDENRGFDLAASFITESARGDFSDIPESQENLINLIQSAVFSDLRCLGLAVPVLYKMLADQSNLTDENLKIANILGWCVNMLNVAHQVAEDLTNKNKKGKLGWHEKVKGRKAVFNFQMLMQLVYRLLLKHLSTHPNYIPITEWMRLVNTNMAIGQVLDNFCAQDEPPPSKVLTVERFKTLAKYKNFYPLLNPIVTALYFSGKHNEEMQQQAEGILSTFAEYSRARDDVLCYQDRKERHGQVDGDIRFGKCTWLAVNALELATDKQKEVFMKNYGRPNDESAQEIRTLYENLKIMDAFLDFEDKILQAMKMRIRETHDLLRNPLVKYVSALFPRKVW